MCGDTQHELLFTHFNYHYFFFLATFLGMILILSRLVRPRLEARMHCHKLRKQRNKKHRMDGCATLARIPDQQPNATQE